MHPETNVISLSIDFFLEYSKSFDVGYYIFEIHISFQVMQKSWVFPLPWIQSFWSLPRFPFSVVKKKIPSCIDEHEKKSQKTFRVVNFYELNGWNGKFTIHKSYLYVGSVNNWY